MTPRRDPDAPTGQNATGFTGQWARRRHSPTFLIIAGTLAVLFFALFVGLGTWQVKRRAWKLDLIARVEERVHAPPRAAPGPAQWPSVANEEYRHVTATGTFLDASQTLVQAITELGAGYWVLTPLQMADGSTVLINRGFVPADARDRVQPGNVGAATGTVAGADTYAAAPMTTVIGLLRITEPNGAFLRHNDPAANRWYSRDVAAIAAACGLARAAPYFIDAEAGRSPPPAGAATPVPTDRVEPVPGLTVITFHNSHLVYAITWYTLALMVAGAIWVGIRDETRP